MLGLPLKATPEEMLMMRPPPRAFIAGSTARAHRKIPSTFTSMTRRHSAGSISSKGFGFKPA